MGWDTTGVFGPNRSNGLQTPPGHKFDGDVMKNPGATAIATGAKDVVEGVLLYCHIKPHRPIQAMLWGALV